MIVSLQNHPLPVLYAKLGRNRYFCLENMTIDDFGIWLHRCVTFALLNYLQNYIKYLAYKNKNAPEIH